MSLPKNAVEIVEFAATGEIVESIIKMPMLWSKRGASDKFGYWQICIGLAERELEPSEIEPKDTNGDWQGLLESWEPVTQDLIERGDCPDGYVGIYWTISGQEDGKESVSKPSFITVGKNEGKANYTTPFTQALREAMTQYNAKVRKGHITEDARKFIKKEGDTYTLEELIAAKHRGESPWRIHVMTLHDVNKANNWRHVQYPCYIQPKFNGTHFVVVHHPELPEHFITTGTEKVTVKGKSTVKKLGFKWNGDWYSRGMKDVASQDHIIAELAPSLEKRPGLHVTGELYIHGSHLQDIAGAARRVKDDTSKRGVAPKQEFHIFDVFYINEPEMPFEERLAIIDEMCDEMAHNEPPAQWCSKVQEYICDDKEQLMVLYQSFLDEKMEGGVIRNKDSPYEVGVDKAKRSYQTLKIKPREDEEFEIVDFTDGDKGKDKGALKWVCKTIDDDEKTLEFNVTPNWTYEVRYAAFKKLTANKKWFNEKIKGQMATISFSEKSKDGKPQQPKFLQFRDPDVEKEFADKIGIELE